MINMAMGLDLLGRGEKLKAIRAGGFHVIGSSLGGLTLGGVLGWLGSLFGLPEWRPWLLLLLGSFALWHAVAGKSFKLGRQCQVNRRWKQSISVELGYFLWGWQLGCGIATFIPYSCFIVLLGVQCTSGWAIGLLSGALFGCIREAVILPVLWQKPDEQKPPSRLMQLLPSLACTVQRLHLIWLLLGVPILVIGGWLH
jgi:hypothetical protein